MKIRNILFLGIAAIGLVACGGKNGNSQQNEEFRSPDLTSFFLQGPVKNFVDNENHQIAFDEQGRIVEAETGFTDIDGKPLVFRVLYDKIPDGTVVNGSIVKRDGKGRIIWLGWNNNSCSGEEGYHFEYEKEEVLMRHWYDSGDCTMPVTDVTKVDDNGNPLQEIYRYGDEEGDMESVIDYEYVTFDDYGNWIERKAKVQTTTTTYTWDEEKGEEGKSVVETQSSEKTEKRKINYYE